MKLDAYQEEQLIEKYDRLLWSIVHKFKRKMRKGFNNEEDLHSECVLVLIQHIRSCNTMDEIKKIPVLTMTNAMCRYVLGEQILSYPRRTANFHNVMNKVNSKADYADVDKDESKRCDPTNDVIDGIDFKDFVNHLSQDDKKIIVMKLRGHTNREIANDLNVSDVAMTRAIKKLRKFYDLIAA